jgi:hypothetical protein
MSTGTPASIEKVYVNAFNSGFAQAFQQMDSILMPHVEVVNQQSEFEYYDRIGTADEPTKDTTRYGLNPTSEVDFDRRRIEFEDYELGKYIDPKDLHRIATDPTSPVVQTFAYSFKRKVDDIVIDGVFDPAYVGKEGKLTIEWVAEGGTSFSGKIKVGARSPGHTNPISTAGNYVLQAGDYEGVVVAHDYTGTTAASSGLTLAKLKGYRQTLLRMDAITQDQIIDLFITAKQFDDLLGIDEIINSDYAVRKSLAEGNVTTFMGYRFIHLERLPVDASGRRRCIAMANNNKQGRYALKLAMAQPIGIEMWRDTARKNIPYIYGKMKARAHRFWGEITGEIKCAE